MDNKVKYIFLISLILFSCNPPYTPSQNDVVGKWTYDAPNSYYKDNYLLVDFLLSTSLNRNRDSIEAMFETYELESQKFYSFKNNYILIEFYDDNSYRIKIHKDSKPVYQQNGLWKFGRDSENNIVIVVASDGQIKNRLFFEEANLGTNLYFTRKNWFIISDSDGVISFIKI